MAIAILFKIVMPLAVCISSNIRKIRLQKLWELYKNLETNKQAIINFLADIANLLSLCISSTHFSSNQIEPLVTIFKNKKEQILRHILITGNKIQISSLKSEQKNEVYNFKSEELVYKDELHVYVNVLSQPSDDEQILADIIFIHGLHGSLTNTWKQGLWSNERLPVDFKRSPQIIHRRAPKRSRYLRSFNFSPPRSCKRLKMSDISTDNNNLECCSSVIERNSIYREYWSYLNDNSSDKKCDMEQENSAFCNFRKYKHRLSPRPRTVDNYSLEIKSKHNTFEEPYSKCWPADWLPLDCPGTRIIAVNYTTDPHLWRPIWIKKHHRTTMSERARIMIEHLVKLKVGQNRPIVWVGHSKGGLYIKKILVDLWEARSHFSTQLLKNSRGIFFYSVPHAGSSLASINLPFVRRSIELVEIEKDSKYLYDLHRRFLNFYYSVPFEIKVFSFVETALTFMQVIYLRIVGVDSADPGIGDICGLQLDHREVCKPRSRRCILYTELVKMINAILENANQN